MEPLPEPKDGENVSYLDPGERPIDNCTIFLGFTSNMISSGVREGLKRILAVTLITAYCGLLPFC